MKLSLEWLADHIKVDASAAELAERLTSGGHAVDAVEKVGGDHVLELDITANRPDGLNVRGLAREIGALYRTPLIDLAPLLELVEADPPAAESVLLQNDVPDLCRRFTIRIVRGVQVGPSPRWLATRLERVGVRPINVVVDITNYVMLELGHPLHAFDLKKLQGGQLHVRLASAGERLVTLDGAERRLAEGMILICDAARPVSLAGVMGGRDTEISATTSDVLLEAAWWDPVTIYRTGRSLGLASDAAYRFERGTDPEATVAALDRAARLVADLAGGQVASGTVDDYPGRRGPGRVSLRLARLTMLLGMSVEADEAAEVLERLEFGVQRTDDGLDVTVPTHRGDISREEDLIEEVGRIVGYDRVPETLPLFTSAEHGRSRERSAERQVRRLMEDAGFLEAVNYTFIARADDMQFSRWPEDILALSNPMSEKGDVLRSSLLPSLTRNAAHNISHGSQRPRLYEIGRVFRRVVDEELPDERLHLALIAAGAAAPPHWSYPAKPVDLFDLKGALESVVDHLRLPRPESREGGPGHLEAGCALTWVLDGVEIAWMGRLAPAVASAMELEAAAMIAEIDLQMLLAAPQRSVRHRPIPRYPSVTRDLSLVLPRSHGYAEVEATIRDAGGDLVTAMAPFDRYSGPGLPDNTIGLSVSLSFQHPERTLVSEEVDAVQQKIVEALAHDLGARLRE